MEAHWRSGQQWHVPGRCLVIYPSLSLSLALFCLFFPLSRFWIVAAASLCFGDADVGGAQKLVLLLLVCGLALVWEPVGDVGEQYGAAIRNSWPQCCRSCLKRRHSVSGLLIKIWWDYDLDLMSDWGSLLQWRYFSPLFPFQQLFKNVEQTLRCTEREEMPEK